MKHLGFKILQEVRINMELVIEQSFLAKKQLFIEADKKKKKMPVGVLLGFSI